MLLCIVCVAIVCYYLGYWVGVRHVGPPSHISYCVAAKMHQAGRECPACGPDKGR